MSYKTKDEVLKSFMQDSRLDENGDDIWELFFREGGKSQRVMVYYSLEDADKYMEEDALMYWSRVLSRTWDDGDFEKEEKEKATVLRFRDE